MISPYIILGVLGVIGVLFAMFKYEQYKANIARDKQKKAEERVQQSKEVIAEQIRLRNAGKAVEIRLRDRRKEDQAKIDSGDRSGFDNDEY
jgi:Flp pilus assembly protein TadB